MIMEEKSFKIFSLPKQIQLEKKAIKEENQLRNRNVQSYQYYINLIILVQLNNGIELIERENCKNQI